MAEVFRAEIRSNGRTAAGISVPPEVVERLGQGKRPPVTVTIAGKNAELMLKLYEELDAHVDVAAVYANFEMSDDELLSLAGPGAA